MQHPLKRTTAMGWNGLGKLNRQQHIKQAAASCFLLLPYRLPMWPIEKQMPAGRKAVEKNYI